MTFINIDDIPEIVKGWELVRKNKYLQYYNVSVSFDIETTSFIQNQEERATMYIWAMCLNGQYIIGRTWEEWLNVLNTLKESLQLNKNKRLILYVHNLQFETAFIKGYFDIEKVLANNIRKPIMFNTTDGLEFRCSYLLSGYSLETLANVYLKNRVKKMVGDLDYSLKRNSKTRLTRREIQYLYNDVRIVYEYINMEINRNGNIAKIPLTKTGYVRRTLKLNCVGGNPVRGMRTEKRFTDFRKTMRNLTISNVTEYELLNRGYSGGLTHTSCFNAGKTFDNTSMWDETSCYPAQLFKLYPMSSGRRVLVKTEEELEEYLQKYCCIFDIEFINIEDTFLYEHYLSTSKCVGFDKHNGYDLADNGRVVKARHIYTTITDVDYRVIKLTYKWKFCRIGRMYVYQRGYLPKPIIETILQLYEAKTVLKGVSGREEEYLSGKEQLNSIYGCMVQRVLHEEYTINNGQWITKNPDGQKEIERYNNTFNRVTYYPWGLFCTAYGRSALYGLSGYDYTVRGGILYFKDRYIYADTDSLKIVDVTEKDIKEIEKYNTWITKEINKCLRFYHIPTYRSKPKTINGVPKPLGVWDFEGVATFKALHSKCYMTRINGIYTLTVSGLRKDTAKKYLHIKYGNNLFDVFNYNLYIPKGYTGRQTHKYFDTPIQGILTDYQGNKAEYKELSGIYLTESEYTMKTDDFYMRYLQEVQYETKY